MSTTLPNLLKEIRQSLGITLQEISELTKIPLKYLECIENGEYEHLPADVYVKGFLGKYAEVLRIDKEEVWKRYLREIKEIKGSAQAFAPQEFGRVPRRARFIITPKLIASFLGSLLALVILAYLWHQIGFLVRPPQLVLISPQKDITISESLFLVKGKTGEYARLTINGEEVYVDGNGNFSTEVNLEQGLNILEIRAVNRLGKSSRVTRRVVVE